MIAIPRPSTAELLSILLLVAGLLLSGMTLAADDVTARALKLYEQHHYEDAAHLLQPELAKMDGSRLAESNLALGMIHLKNAKLYRALQQSAVVIELDYLTQLSQQKTGNASRYVDYYLGQALLEAGKQDKGLYYLRRFASKVGARSSERSFADIEMGIAYSRQKQPQKAEQKWSGLDMSLPEIKAAMAGAYAVVGAHKSRPVLMADAAVSDAKKSHYIPSARMNRNLLRAYSSSGAADKALDLLNRNEFKDSSYVEALGTTKFINFYDLSVLGDIYSTNLQVAIAYLEQAKRDAKLNTMATYYLADAYLQQGDAAASLRSAASYLSQPQIPPQYRDLARINQAAAQSMAGQQSKGGTIWLSLAETSAHDPVLLAAVLQACVAAGASCEKFEKMALSAIEKGEGKKFFILNTALGKYYLLQKNYPMALLYMEAGRDKAYKNKIEVNDPEMLVRLAEAYYRNKNFSENLEIYFELGKQYPAVRQIQEAMQGIYSMEHRSAGEVKIF